MAQIEIIHEKEIEGGWQFLAQVLDDDATLRRHRLRLSWADYNHWSAGGGDAPAHVAEAVLQFMLTLRTPAELDDAFDSSIARRLSPTADESIPKLIRDGA